ncbi:MAG TPA: DUF998 domain-containing protein [Bacillota bacterium]|nr:DUF998 domain-containing protein [Bacillota bacterium]
MAAMPLAATRPPRRRSRALAAPETPARRWLLAAGSIGGTIFTATYLIEGATRPGYDAWRQAISALSLGPGGWVQQCSFIVLGVLVACSAIGYRAALRGGWGERLVPAFRLAVAAGLLTCGFFSQDPGPGYPPRAVLLAIQSQHAALHGAGTYLCMFALIGGCLAMAVRFAREPAWRGWSVYSVATALAIMGFMAAFGAAIAHGGPAGLFERLAVGSETVWGAIFLVRLLRRGVAV